MGNNSHLNMSAFQHLPLNDQQFQDTYGEQVILRGDFDNQASVKHAIVTPALSSTVLCPIVGSVLLCCYQPIKRRMESRMLTLGDRSLFYAEDCYCCYGPCMCKINSVEKQVPLDKLQDITLSQSMCARWFGVQTMGFETAGQSGTGLKELEYTSLKNPRDFKQVVLEKRNQVTQQASLGPDAVPGIASVDCSQILLRIEQRLADIEAGCVGRKAVSGDSSEQC